MSFISLEINTGTKKKPDWQYAVLREDTSISVEDTSAVWDTDAGGGAFSYEFELPVEDNLHILGNSCDMRGRSIYKRLYGKQFRLYCGGLCLFYGIVKMDDEIEVEQDEDGDEGRHTIGISLTSDNYEWSELLEGVGARDISLATSFRNDKNVSVLDEDSCNEKNENKIQIGYCVPSYFPLHCYMLYMCYDDAHEDTHSPKVIGYYRDEINTGFYIPKILVTKLHNKTSVEDFTNTSHAYDPSDPDAYPYCNVRICYQHYIQESEDSTAAWTQKRGYGVGEPDRVNSAPCFYVMYWMHLLFRQLGVNVTENIMEKSEEDGGYEDFRRLAFYHTNCGYEEINDFYEENADGTYSGTGKFLKEWPGTDEVKNISTDIEDMNDEEKEDGVVCFMTITGSRQQLFVYKDKRPESIFSTSEGCRNLSASPDIEQAGDRIKRMYAAELLIPGVTDPSVNNVTWNENLGAAVLGDADLWTCKQLPLYKAYANSDNFPDVDASEILEGIQNAFGIRYLYNAKQGTLRIVLVRDILRQTGISDMACEIHKVTKSENHVTGFRLKYSSTEDAETNAITLKEDLTGVKQGTEGSDTTFSYNNYTQPCMLDPTGSNTYGNNASREKRGYGWMLRNVSAYDKTCYLHPVTGNAFRIKVNSDATGGQELYPSLFEVGQMQKAEWGDCSSSKDNSDFIEEVTIGFTPIIENDVNCVSEKVKNPDNDPSADGQTLAQLVDGEFRSYSYTDTDEDGVSKEGDFTVSSVEYHAPFTTWKVYSGDSPKQNADDNADSNEFTFITPEADITLYMAGLTTWDLADNEPTEDNDTGFMLGIMRGSGGDAHTELYDDGYDGASSNTKWLTMPGDKATFSSDSVDQYGYPYDYNGNGTRTTEAKYNLVSGFDGTISNVHIVVGQKVTSGQTIAEIVTDDGTQAIISRYTGKIIEVDMQVGQHVDTSQIVGYLLSVTTDNGANGLGYDLDKVISLRIKAEKDNPGYSEDAESNRWYKYSDDGSTVTFGNGTKVDNKEHFDITASYCQKRGLADRFYSEYADWVLNRKIANITCTMELADLVNIDMTKKYRIGGYEGFIKSLSYTLDNETGLSPVDIEFYYL